MSRVEQLFQEKQRVQDDMLSDGITRVGSLLKQSDGRLTTTLKNARGANPDQAAEVFQLQGKTGLPPDLIKRNIEMVRGAAQEKDFDARQFRQEFPRMAGLLDDPQNAEMAHDDLEALGLIEHSLRGRQQRYEEDTTLAERLWNSARSGALSFRQSMAGLPLVDMIERGAQASQTGDFQAATDPITGMPIPASQVTVGENQQRQLAEGAEAMGDAASVEFASRIAPLQQRLEGIEQRPATQAMMQAGNWGEVFDAFTMDPLGIMADIGITSQVQQLPALALMMATRNPGVAMVSSGANQYALEAGGGIIQYLNRQGVDASDPTQVVTALSDDETATRAVEYAEQRGAVMGAAGAAAGALAPRMLAPGTGQTATREAVNVFAAQPLAQGTLGAGAEGFLQLTQEGEIAPGELFAEFIGEFSGAPIEAGTFTADRLLSRRTPKPVEDAAKVRGAMESGQTLEALGQAARESKLRGRSPDKFRQFVARMQEGTGIESLQVPVERWNELFQGADRDPAQMAEQVTGSPQAYREAMATGGDLSLPLAEYATTIAPTDFHQELMQDIRMRPEDMTRREAEDWMSSAQENVERYVDDLAGRSDDPSAAVYEDVYGQLLAAGRDRATATQEARLTQAVWRTLGERTGMDPAELFGQFNINVTRPLPEVLRSAGGDFDAQVDPLLDRLRAGDISAQTDALGPSLLDFLRERGVRDDGGELAARDVDANRKAFQRAILRDDGLTPDDAAQAAAEAGYLRGFDRDTVTPDALTEAVGRELRDGPVFSDLNADEQLEGTRRTLEELSDYLQQIGADLNAMDNESVKALLRGDDRPQAEDGEQTTTLDQRGPRARITFPQSRRFFNIEFLEGANLSSFLHESGHLYLEVLRELAQRDDAPEQIRQDYQRLLDWFGVDDADSIGTDQHEQFARGFEAYLLEGNAPSAELRSVFARFRAWLVAIYRSVRNLDVDLTDEVRGVMDRLVATDQEITEAREEAGYRPLFEDAQAAGMTPDEYERYRQSAEQAKVAAEDELTRRVMREQQRESQAWWKESREQVREEVANEVNQRREYVALSVLQRGTLPDGSPLPDGTSAFKINKRSLIDAGYGESLSRLPRPYVYSREGGVPLDMAADMLGYRSGNELFEALANARPRAKLIEAETDSRMRERHGDMLNDGSMADAALEAVHNDQRADVMQRELRALASRSRRRATPMSAIREAAQRIIAGKAVRDIKPGLYLRAEQKAGRDAFNAVAENNYDQAIEAKQRQLLNHELYREARQAKEMSEQAYREARRFTTRTRQERLGKAGPSYREQVNGILERYEFRRVTRQAQGRRESLANFLNGILPDDGLANTALTDQQLADKAMEKATDSQRFTITADMVNEARRVNWQQLTVEELSGVRDMLRLIWRQATLKDELLKNQRTRSLEEARDAIVTTVNENTRTDIKASPANPTPGERASEGFSNYLAEHRKLSSLVRQMDGGQDAGTVWDLIMRPLNEAGDTESLRIRKEGEALGKLFRKHYSDKELREMTPRLNRNRTFYPEVNMRLGKFDVVTMALNWGNEVNRSRVMDGFSLANQQVTSLFNRVMTRKDWEFVQEVWDYLDTFWSEIAGMNERIYGIPPERVEPSSVVTPFGEYRGGYFPIRYSKRLSTRAREQGLVNQSRANSGSARVSNRIQAGFTQSRQAKVERQLDLDGLMVIQDHVSEVIHEITHTETILDVGRIMKERDVAEIIERRLGRDIYRQMIDRLADIKFGPERARTAMERTMLYFRSGTSVAFLGFNVGTMLLQPLGVTNSIARLAVRAGYSAMLKGYTEYLSSPVATTRLAMQKSEMMRTRTMQQNREMNEIRNTIERKTTQKKIAESSMIPMAAVQLVAVDIPTWITTYRKAMSMSDDEGTAIAVADQAVLDAQGGGAVKDLAGVQTGSAWKKLFSMFMSYMVTTWNLSAESFRRTDFRSPAEVMKFGADMLLLMVVPAVGSVFLDGLRNGWDDDEEFEERYLKEQVSFVMGMFLGVRDVSGLVTGYRYSGPAGTSIFGETVSLGQQVGQGEMDQALFNATADTLGITLHLPSGQIKRTTDGAWSIYEGNPDNAGEAAKMLIFGDRDN
ncbi:hypothetical protein R3F64_03235 [Halomonas sp. 5021]|uniref:hypothetical protein n=1 Tax=Halomonas sp. 5021 TaxID=3082156 RepID=UPI002FC74C58